MFYTVLCQNSLQPSDQDKLNSIPSMSIFISFYKCRLMQEKVGRGRGEDMGRQQHTRIALPSTPQSYITAQHSRAKVEVPQEGCPTQRPGSIPGSSCSAPMHVALLEGLAHQYCSSETSPNNW